MSISPYDMTFVLSYRWPTLIWYQSDGRTNRTDGRNGQTDRRDERTGRTDGTDGRTTIRLSSVRPHAQLQSMVHRFAGYVHFFRWRFKNVRYLTESSPGGVDTVKSLELKIVSNGQCAETHWPVQCDLHSILDMPNLSKTAVMVIVSQSRCSFDSLHIFFFISRLLSATKYFLRPFDVNKRNSAMRLLATSYVITLPASQCICSLSYYNN